MEDVICIIDRDEIEMDHVFRESNQYLAYILADNANSHTKKQEYMHFNQMHNSYAG